MLSVALRHLRPSVTRPTRVEAKMSSTQTSSMHRKHALLSATAGVIFVAVAVFGKDWDWRGLLSFIAGVIYLIISVQQFRKAKIS